MRAFTRPHDLECPGQRDYYCPPEPSSALSRVLTRPYPGWVFDGLLIIWLAGMALLCVGCVGITPARQGHYTPEPLHPSLDRIAELAAISNQPSITNPGWLRLSSPFVLAGNGVRLTCLVPEHRDHRYLRLSLVDAVGPLWTITHATQTDHLLIESVPCGSYAAVCDSLANSDRVLAHYEQRFTSKGSCNDGGDR